MANIANYNIIVTATSVTHTKALADYLEEQVLKSNICSLVNLYLWLLLFLIRVLLLCSSLCEG